MSERSELRANSKPRGPAARRVFRVLTDSLRHEAGVREGDGVLVACSGGADSMALLRAMHEIASRRRWKLRVEAAHVQHHLRDRAEGDADFVASLCDTLGMAYHRIDLEGLNADDVGNVEAEASRRRYLALADVAIEQGLSYVLTAHHADDQLETLLMRLVRGSGIAGMTGIAPRKTIRGTQASHAVTLARPLLGITRATLRDYLDSLGQAFCHDETNDDSTRTRAALRQRVTPALLEMRPDLPERLADFTRHATGLADWLEDAAEQTLRASSDTLSRTFARGLPEAVLHETLRRLLVTCGEPPDRVNAARVRQIAKAVTDRRGGERRFPLRDGVLILDSQTLRFESRV